MDIRSKSNFATRRGRGSLVHQVSVCGNRDGRIISINTGSSSGIFLSSGGLNPSPAACFFLGRAGVWGKFWPDGYRLCAGASWGRGGSACWDEDAPRYEDGDDGRGGIGFDRAVIEAADRDCATDSGKGGSGGASVLCDKVGRAAPKVIDRDLRSDCESLRMRPGVATDGARGGADGSLYGGRGGFEEGNGCSAE